MCLTVDTCLNWITQIFNLLPDVKPYGHTNKKGVNVCLRKIKFSPSKFSRTSLFIMLSNFNNILYLYILLCYILIL